MTDKEMFLSMSTVEVDDYQYPPVRARAVAPTLPGGTAGLRPEETFLPWRCEPLDLPAPFSPFGGEHILRFTGSSHDEHGMLAKDPAVVGRLNEHLWHKIDDHNAEIEMATVDRQAGATTLLVSYGITARAMAEATHKARASGRRVSTLTIQSLWPVPERAILAAAGAHDGQPAVERIIVAEMNLGQYRREIEGTIYRWAARTRQVAPEVAGIERIDGELITPDQFLGAF
jgi:2-oxoglutarate ferredoxin oxidoreductase subunit alpha